MSSHLHCSQDGKANVASPDHGKTLLAREERAAGDGCHCLLARVDQVGVNLWIARLKIEFYNPYDFHNRMSRKILPGQVWGRGQDRGSHFLTAGGRS